MSKHYNKTNIKAWDVIEDWGLNFNLGKVVEYVERCEHKESKKKDLETAMRYLRRELSSI